MKLLNKEMTQPKERLIKVVQFGEGNFLRGFCDYMIDLANEQGKFDGGISLVQPIPFGIKEIYEKQDCQYTLQLRGLVNGKESKETRIITSCQEIVSPFDDYEQYIRLATMDSVRFVISNTTEAGIVYHEEDSFEEKLNNTFPAKLTQFLYTRFQHYQGNIEKGLIILPVELIDDNGTELEKCVKQYVKLWNLEAEFVQWLDDACEFANTLVDRIVTGYPRDEVESLWQEVGYEDQLFNTAEPFALWVIETKKEISKEFPLDEVMATKEGMEVIFTNNQKPYKQRKVRILNGAHTSFVLMSYLKGNNTVKDSMVDETVRKFMLSTIKDEVIPTLDMNQEELMKYAEAVVDRFNNPFIKHELLSISLNSVSKWRARCLPSLKEYIQRNGSLPKHLTYSLAALIAFYHGDSIEEGALIGKRNGEVYKIKDDLAVLEFFKENCMKAEEDLVPLFLSKEEFHGEDLTKIEGLTEAVTSYLHSIRTGGIEVSLKETFNYE